MPASPSPKANSTRKKRASTVPASKRPPNYAAVFPASGDLAAKWGSRKRNQHVAALIRTSLAERPWWSVPSVVPAGGDLYAILNNKQLVYLLDAGEEDVKPVHLFPLFNPIPPALTTVPRGAMGLSPALVDFATLLRQVPKELARTKPETCVQCGS